MCRLEKASAAGHARSMYHLAYKHQNGLNGLTKSAAAAVEWCAAVCRPSELATNFAGSRSPLAVAGTAEPPWLATRKPC